MRTIIKSLREYKKESIQTPIFIALEVIFECIIPFVMAKLIDDMTGNTLKPIIKYSIMLIIFATLSLASGILSGKKAATASCGFAKNLRRDLFNKVQDLSFADIDKFSSSSLVTRLTTDVTNIQNAFMMVIKIAVRMPLMIIFSVIMCFVINWKIALDFVVLIPVLGIALFLIMFKVKPIFDNVFKKYDALNNSVEENVSGIRVVKSFARENYETKKFYKSAEDVQKDFTKAEKLIALNNPIMMFCIFATLIIVSFFGAKLIVGSGGTELTTGELTSLMSYGIQILVSMMMLSMVFVMISISIASIKRITEVLSYTPTLKNSENVTNDIADGSIEYKNVSFKYSENAEKYALEGINLLIKSGETIGILGDTGSSKSSLIQLIPRLYDATEGVVLVGGKDVREYDIDSLRNEVSIVLQKNTLFSGTIKENLRWGNNDASDEELERVCNLAQADEFIQKLPDKYDTYIEQGGTNVSGGQKQRLCIARALLKKPKILIFDDSTSAVDTKTDAFIRKALKEEIPDTTKLIIAQRVSSVEDSDKIIVMDRGKISEIGTHLELMEKKGLYYSIYKSQTKQKEGNKSNEK